MLSSSSKLPFIHPPESLCVLRLSAIGDVCNAVAAVQAIQREWPETRITWIVGKTESVLLRTIEGIEIITLDKKGGWRGYVALYKVLRKRYFDVLLHMHASMRANITSLFVRAPLRLGFDAIRTADKQRWFINTQVASPASPHVVDGFMSFTETLGIKNIKPRWSFVIPEEDIAWASVYKSDQPLMVISPASSKVCRNWTSVGYAVLARHAVKQGFEVILTGGSSLVDRELSNQICMYAGNAIQHNLMGKTTLLQLLALLKQADIVCSPDSGPAHMAAALGKPVLGIYAHQNPRRTGPYGWEKYVASNYQENIMEETGLDITQLPWRARVKNPFAMQDITSESVLRAFDVMLKEHVTKIF